MPNEDARPAIPGVHGGAGHDQIPLIGQGKTPREAMEEVGAVVEGYFAAESIHQLSERVGVEMPISRCAYEVLYQGKQIRGVVAELMTRAKKDELLETAWL